MSNISNQPAPSSPDGNPPVTDKNYAYANSLKLPRIARNLGIGILIIFGPEVGCHLSEITMRPDNFHIDNVRRDSSQRLEVSHWLEEAKISRNNDVHLFMHAGGNALTNMPLAVAMIEELDDRGVPVSVELRIDHHVIQSTCKLLGLAPLSIDEFNLEPNQAVIDIILTKKYPTLLSACAGKPSVKLAVVTQGEGNSYTEALDYFTKLPMTNNQIIVVPSYSVSTGIRAGFAFSNAELGDRENCQLRVVDFPELPSASWVDRIADTLSSRAAQIGIMKAPDWLRRFKYWLVNTTPP